MAVTAATRDHVLSPGKAATMPHDNEMCRSLWLKCGDNQCDKVATLRAIAWLGIRTHCGSSMPLLPAVPKLLRRLVISATSRAAIGETQRLGPGVVSRTVARGQSGTSFTTRRSELKLSGDRRPYRTAADCRSQSRPCGLRRGRHTLARRDTTEQPGVTAIS